ncbi:unnamed protein product [Symbiodinium necroappetens]|uniref:Aconitase X catalytic domain-containing protein n=1 Tax=Symbiodinium necroappetens TaxID=1628268 RepID=A0A813AN14_9DINO|nr:unnamed protein product [Symbiodinium necroappetens]
MADAPSEIRGQLLSSGGKASGEVLVSSVGLSFWGGVSPKTGAIIDRHHPLHGRSLRDKILVLPGGRGSCTGSQVILELLLNGNGPAAIVLRDPDEIIALGAIVAEEMFDVRLPVMSVGDAGFARLLSSHAGRAILEDGSLFLGQTGTGGKAPAKPRFPSDEVELSADDQSMLEGVEGPARQAAMRWMLSDAKACSICCTGFPMVLGRGIICRMARVQGVKDLISVSQSHIDGCTYVGPASLQFAEKLRSWDAEVRVPTTLNAISVDRLNWRMLGVPADSGEPAEALANAYLAMGAAPSFTCAPYLLENAPRLGEQIGWGESNAVVFANSILGARTQKYADFLDACVAITGRAPRAGCHVDGDRKPEVILAVPELDPGQLDDAFYPTLGYLCGLRSPHSVPAITGLEHLAPTRDDLKAFCTAFGTSSSAAMFHLVGLTPEARDLQSVLPERQLEVIQLGQDDLKSAWTDLDADADESAVDLVALGNPHFSLEEHRRLAELCRGREKHPLVAVVLTAGPQVLAQARERGYSATLEEFGVQLVSDTCWCMLGEVVPAPASVLPASSRVLMTNSAKYAHYAPGLVGRKVRFGSLAGCVDAACGRTVGAAKPAWLIPGGLQSRTRACLAWAANRGNGSLQVPSDDWIREAEARHERASQSCLRVQEQVHALVDFLAQEHVRQPQGREGPREKEIPRATSGHKPNPQAVAKLAQHAELSENPMLSERLRRIFSPPSRGNSVDSPPREDFVSGCVRGEEYGTAQAVKVAPPPTGADGATPRDRETQAAEMRIGSHSSCRGTGRVGSKGSITPGPATAPATPAASPQAGGLVTRAAPATAAQAKAWVQRATSGHTTPTAPVLRQVTGGIPGAPALTMVTPQFGQHAVFVAKPANTPIVAVASTQPPMRCQRMSSSSPNEQPARNKRVSAPAHLVQVACDPRLPKQTPFAAQVPQPLPLPPGSTGPRAQYDL